MTGFIARRYLGLRGSGPHTFKLGASVGVGIVLGTFLVFLALGILNGAHQTYEKALLGFNAHVIIYRESPIYEDDQARIADFIKSEQKRLPVFASPFVAVEALFPSDQGMEAVMLKGISLAEVKKVYALEFSDFNVEKNEGVYVGGEILAKKSSIIDKGHIRLLLNTKSSSGQQIKPFGFGVRGSFKSGVHDFDAKFILADIGFLQKNHFGDGRVTGYEIRLDDPGEASAFVDRFRARFGDSFLLMRWDELNADLFTILAQEKAATFAIAIMVILICCINIVGFSILFFILREREFGILSMLGCSLGSLRWLLVRISLVTGGVATFIGAALGVLAVYFLSHGRGISLDPEAYYIDRIPADLPLHWLGIFILITLVLCALASLVASLLVVRRFVANKALFG